MLADFTSVIFSFGRWYGVVVSCTAAESPGKANAPASPPPAAVLKNDLLFDELMDFVSPETLHLSYNALRRKHTSSREPVAAGREGRGCTGGPRRCMLPSK